MLCVAICLLGGAGSQAKAEVWDDFSQPGLASAWDAPETIVVTGAAGNLQMDGTTYPGELAITPNVATGSQNFFYIARNDHTLGVGEVLRLKVRTPGVVQGTPGQDWVGVGMSLHQATNRSTYLLYYALNDTRMVGSNGNSEVLISTWAVNQPLELYIQRAGLSSFRLGYKVGSGPFVPAFSTYNLVRTEPPVGSGMSLFINWDERSGAASGKIILDELGTVPNPGFPEVPLTAVTPGERYGFPGDLIYFDGTRSPGRVESYAWTFPGPATTRTVTNQAIGAHVFQTTGTHPVQLRITYADQSTTVLQTTARIMNTPPGEPPMPLRGFLTGGGNSVSVFNNPTNWEATFTWMEQLGLNTAISIQEHPYHYFVRIPGYPEANNDVSDALLANRRVAFENILQRARNHGIKLYFLVYNVFLPPTFATAHGLPVSGSSFSFNGTDTALTRAYTKAAVKEFLSAFPDVGLCVTVGESPVGCVDFVRETIIAAMKEVSGAPRELILRDQALYPDQAFTLAGDLPAGSWRMMSKLTEEQFLPGAGYRGRLFTQSMGVRNLYLQSRATDGFFIGAPRFTRQLCEQLASDHALGLIIASDSANEWVLREGIARYLQNPNRPEAEEAVYWANRMRQQYGPLTPAETFLSAGEAASQILPLVRSQLFYRNNNYRVHFGLPLISYLGMPSFTSFQHGGIIYPENESLLSWWYPRAGRHLFDPLTIREFVLGSKLEQHPGLVAPTNIIEQLDQLAATAEGGQAALEAYTATANGSQYVSAVRTIKFMALMGRHYAAKMRAALAWQRWSAGQLPQHLAEVEVSEELVSALSFYLRAIPVYQSIFGASPPPPPFLMAADNQQPPWGSDQNFRGTVTGGMPELSRVWQTEVDEMRRRMAAGDETLPYFEYLQARAPATYRTPAAHWSEMD